MTDREPWASLHIFIHDFSRLNAFARVALRTLPSEILEKSFFIRYWYGGPHVRLRFRPAGYQARVEDHLRSYLAQNEFQSTLSADIFYRNYEAHLPEETGPGGGSPAWFHNGSIQRIPYVPEVGRYGGGRGIGLAEDYFVHDSAVILDMLVREPDAAIEKILFGFTAVHAAVLHEWGEELDSMSMVAALLPKLQQPQAMHEIIRERARTPAVRSALLRATAGESFPRYLLPLRERLLKFIAACQERDVAGIPNIVNSLLHMSFNRAGVPPGREVIVRWLVSECHI